MEAEIVSGTKQKSCADLCVNFSMKAASVGIVYNQGTKSYELDQTLQPDEQMWIDVGSLIRQHIPDKNGNSLPENLTMGSYEIREVGHNGIGSLFEGKVVYDKTYGHVTYGCASCCGLKEYQFNFDPLGIPLSGTAQQSVEGVNNCQGTWTDITLYFNGGSWNTANHVIATVNSNGLHSGASEGSTNTSACSKNDMAVWENFDHCPLDPVCPDDATDNTIKFTISGNQYKSIFVGTDPGLQVANTFAADTKPTNGTLTAKSSDGNDTFTYGSLGAPTAVIQTKDQSTDDLDRTLTFEYSVSGEGSVSQSLTVTARQFAYATNDSAGNTCSLGYGYNYTYTYTPYTHPDKIAVQPGIGVDGTVVSESFNPPTFSCSVSTGPGSINANSQFTDNIALCSNKPLPQCSSTNIQTLTVAGYGVRNDSLTIANTGLTYVSQGPTQ